MGKWIKLPDEGWLEGNPAYRYDTNEGYYWVARDYGDDDDTKTEWFLHFYDHNGQGDFIAPFDRLKDAKAYVGDK
jgi:hypothetical protein